MHITEGKGTEAKREDKQLSGVRYAKGRKLLPAPVHCRVRLFPSGPLRGQPERLHAQRVEAAEAAVRHHLPGLREFEGVIGHVQLRCIVWCSVRW